MKLLKKYSTILLMLLLPTQLAYHFWPNWSYVFGLRIDMLAPAIYLTDIFVVTILMLNSSLYKNNFKYLVVGVVFMLINIIVSNSPLESFYKWIKFLEFGFLSFYIFKQKVLDSTTIIYYLFYSSVLVSVIGILQFLSKNTIGGVLYWLGERSFNSATPGVALFSINGIDYLRAYSIFSHPNSLAGYLGVVMIIFLLNMKLFKNYMNILGFVLISICFVLTFSMTAFIALFITLVINLLFSRSKFYRQLIVYLLFSLAIISLSFPIIAGFMGNQIMNLGQNISQRIDLAYVSGQIISHNFLFGSGIGTFISEIPKYKGIYSYSWVLQPVHNIYLLVLSELGLSGFLATFFIVKNYIKSLIANNNKIFINILVFIFITGLSDHYWIMLQQNQLLLSLLIGLSLRYDIHYEKR